MNDVRLTPGSAASSRPGLIATANGVPSAARRSFRSRDVYARRTRYPSPVFGRPGPAVEEGRVNKLLVILVVAAAAVQSGCEDGVQAPCLPYPGVGLVVTVVNDQTAEPLCDAVVTAQAQDGSAPWRMSANTARCAHIGSGAGTYSVRAERPGFGPASVLVRVASSGGECPVAIETPVTIRLVAVTQLGS